MAPLLTGTYGLDEEGPITKYVKGAASDAGSFAWDMVKPVSMRQKNTAREAEIAGSGHEWYDWVNYGVDTGNTALALNKKASGFVQNSVVANPKSKLGKMAIRGVQGMTKPFAAGVADGALVPPLRKFGWKGVAGNMGIGIGANVASVMGEMASEAYVRDDEGHRSDWDFAGQLGDYELQERIAKAYSSSRRSDRQIKSVLNGTSTGATIGLNGAIAGAAGGTAVALAHGLIKDDGEFSSGDPKFLEANEKSNRQSRIDFINSVFKTPRGLVDPAQEDEATDMLVRDYLINSRKHPQMLKDMMPLIKSLMSRAEEDSASKGYFDKKPSRSEQTAERILTIKKAMESGELNKAYETLSGRYADNRKFTYPDIKK
jgi:hypothetical protein